MKQMKYTAIVIDTKDPERKNRLKIKIQGVHPDYLKEEHLPWTQVQPSAGGNAGTGPKSKFEIGQAVTVEPLDEAKTEWIITGGSTSVINPNKEPKDGFETDKTKENKNLLNTSIPGIATGDPNILSKTSFDLLNTNLVSVKTSGNASLIPPAEPATGFPINVPKSLDLRFSDLTVLLPKEFLLHEKIKFKPGTAPEIPVQSSDLKIVLKVDKDGNIIEKNNLDLRGFQVNGETKYPEIRENKLFLPGGMWYDQTKGYSEYTITVIVSTVKNPLVTHEMDVSFYVGDSSKVPKQRKTRRTRASGGSQPPFILNELPSTADKSYAEEVSCNTQGDPVSGITETNDTTPGFECKETSVNGTRLRQQSDGKMLIKATDNLQIIGKPITVYSDSLVAINGKNYIQLISDSKVYIKAPVIEIEGNVKITGTLHVTGNITTDSQVIDGNVNLSTHTHTGDSGGNTSGPK